VVVQSQAAAVMLQQQGLRRPTHRISCGIDLDDFHVDADLDRSAIRARFGLHPSQVLLLFVGRVDHEKLLDVPIRALARAECAGIQLAIAGHGADLSHIQHLAKSKAVSDRVHCLGYVSDADRGDLLNSADIFIMPSDAELLSIATLEAMACGRPILAARAQALPELVTDGENGRLFRPGDVGDAAAAMADLAGRPEAWPAMGALSRQHAEAHAWPAVLSRFERLYAATIARQPAAVAVAERGSCEVQG
jgi:glycosyltransferase involved in cell wall biosynthesis